MENDFAYGERMMLANIPRNPENWSDTAMTVTQKNAIVNFERRINLLQDVPKIKDNVPRIGDYLASLLSFYKDIEMTKNIVNGSPPGSLPVPLVNVIGSPGIEVTLNNDGSLIYLTSAWPQIKGVSNLRKTVPPTDAYGSALESLGGGNEYRLSSWNWGYAPVPRSPTEMRLYHLFHFVPNEEEGYTGAKYPPRDVWIDGQTGVSCKDGAVPVPRNTVCVTGYVINHRELAVDGTKFVPPLRVEAVPAGGGPSYFADVDSNGFFKFENLPVGDYNFRMQLPPGWDGLVPTAADGGVAETGVTTLEKQSDCYRIVFKIRRLFDLTGIKWEELLKRHRPARRGLGDHGCARRGPIRASADQDHRQWWSDAFRAHPRLLDHLLRTSRPAGSRSPPGRSLSA